MRTHPDIGLMTARQQACSRLAATCAFLAVLVSMEYSRFTVKALERRIQVSVITISRNFGTFCTDFNWSHISKMAHRLGMLQVSKASLQKRMKQVMHDRFLKKYLKNFFIFYINCLDQQ